jgi:Uma2 family endonuclease
MVSEPALQPMSQDAFLEWEARQDRRYEYANGKVFAMTGASQRHDLVRGAIFASLFAQLKRGPCRPLLDIRVVCPNGRVRYPDVMVDCAPRQDQSLEAGAPKVVVEVLSPSTQSTDYLVKSVDYGSVPSVDVYLIVDPREPRAAVLRRGPTGLVMEREITGSSGEIPLPEINAVVRFIDIYPEPD